MELRISAVDVKAFSACSECKTFVAEASDLREYNLRQRLYDDAADAGFALWNAATNAVTRWMYSDDSRCPEGELLVEFYVPTPETLRAFPQLAGWKVHVLND